MEALRDHLQFCDSHLGLSERVRLESLLENYEGYLKECALDESSRSFDWYSYICDESSGFLLAGRVPLTALDEGRLSRRRRGTTSMWLTPINPNVEDNRENVLVTMDREEIPSTQVIDGNSVLFDGEIVED